MHKKKATPTAATKAHHDGINSNLPYKPQLPRERRLLNALMRGAVIRHDLDDIVGTDNAPEYVSRLRSAGWDITTERIPKDDRDGGTARIGRYHLSTAHQVLAQQMLNEG